MSDQNEQTITEKIISVIEENPALLSSIFTGLGSIRPRIEVISRKGEAAKIHEPLKTNITGSIKSPIQFATHRGDEIQSGDSHLKYNLTEDKVSIVLVVNENDPLNIIEITGRLRSSKEAAAFNLNQDEDFTIDQLREKFKKLVHRFSSKDEYLGIIGKLRNFNAKVESFYKDHKDDSTGSVSQQFERKVLNAEGENHNYTFKIKIKIFEDEERVELPVQLWPVAKNSGVHFKLACPDLYYVKDELATKLVNEVINSEFFKDIPHYNITE